MFMDKRYIQFKELNNYNNVGHLYTKRPYDFNIKINSNEFIEEEYDEILKLFNYDFKYIKGANQTHSSNVKVVSADNLYDDFDDCDGLLTNLKGIALITKTADCQSILLYDDKHEVIGNVHSGWRGTLNTIVLNAIDLMEKTYGTKKEDIKVFICPSIMKCCFEVDSDVMNLFKEKFINIDNIISEKDENGKYFIDTLKINKQLLLNYGLKEQNIFISNICTKCNSDIFHSYRAYKEKSGRNIALIYLKENR